MLVRGSEIEMDKFREVTTLLLMSFCVIAGFFYFKPIACLALIFLYGSSMAGRVREGEVRLRVLGFLSRWKTEEKPPKEYSGGLIEQEIPDQDPDHPQLMP